VAHVAASVLSRLSPLLHRSPCNDPVLVVVVVVFAVPISQDCHLPGIKSFSTAIWHDSVVTPRPSRSTLRVPRAGAGGDRAASLWESLTTLPTVKRRRERMGNRSDPRSKPRASEDEEKDSRTANSPLENRDSRLEGHSSRVIPTFPSIVGALNRRKAYRFIWIANAIVPKSTRGILQRGVRFYQIFYAAPPPSRWSRPLNVKSTIRDIRNGTNIKRTYICTRVRTYLKNYNYSSVTHVAFMIFLFEGNDARDRINSFLRRNRLSLAIIADRYRDRCCDYRKAERSKQGDRLKAYTFRERLGQWSWMNARTRGIPRSIRAR